MSKGAEDLLAGLERKDASLFAEASNLVKGSEVERSEAMRHLIEIVVSGDAKRGELALNAIRYSGLLLDDKCYHRLLKGIESCVSRGDFASLAADKAKACSQYPAKELLYRRRFLRSAILALLRKEDPLGRKLVERIENDLAGTETARQITKWKEPE